MSGSHNHECTKQDCHFCYVINTPSRDPFKNNGWSKAQIEYLIGNYKQVDIEEIERVLKKTRRAIWQKAYSIRQVRNVSNIREYM